MAGQPPRTPAPGPSPADVDAAARHAAGGAAGDGRGHGRRSSRTGWPREGGPPEDWAQLIRSLGVLGRRDEAAAILAEARTKHADDPAALAELDAAARDAGLAP